ncbi:response regulator, partial [Rhodopseudomonas sp. B29]|uniref:response regulator n=1 Tax=Rhodopseudomonas sp. B29 TaxID=95607 RepID=UPI0004CF9980
LVRSYVMTHLAALGYTAFPASSAAQAMAMVYDGFEFDLLFTDVIMPGSMNGPQLASELRRHRPNLRVLFTSGFADTTAFPAGQHGTDLLVKPYRRAELARMLRLVLDARVAAPAH